MTDDTLLDLSDDAVSIKANLEDLLVRLSPHAESANDTMRIWLDEAITNLVRAIGATEKASSFIDSVVQTRKRAAERQRRQQQDMPLDETTRRLNEDENVVFPECPECGAPPGQAHDPTCSGGEI